MAVIELNDHEIKALLFAAKADLETVNNDIETFAGDDEPLLSAIQKLEAFDA